MNLKDYIIKDESKLEDRVVSQKKRNQTEYKYSLIYENDSDFIIRRTTQNTNLELVVLVSQGLCYIKNNKTNKLINVDEASDITNLFKKMPSFNFEKLTWEPFDCGWRTNNMSRVSSKLTTFINNKDIVKILANKKLNPLTNTNLIHTYKYNPERFNDTEASTKTIKFLLPNYEPFSGNYGNLIETIRTLNIDINFLQANSEIIDTLGRAVVAYLMGRATFITIIKDYNCDFKTFLQYLHHTIQNRNGLSITDNGYNGLYDGEFKLNDYVDYLRMQFEIYGKIKEKYPVYWLSEKQMMIRKYSNWKTLRQLQSRQLVNETIDNLEFEEGLFRIIKPKETSEIIDEGEQLQHCVASYIKQVERGDTNIVFLRYVDTPEDSLVTLEVRVVGDIIKLVQARGLLNRNINEAEFKFLNKWCDEKNIEMEVRLIEQN